jgi:hypothetical protein
LDLGSVSVSVSVFGFGFGFGFRFGFDYDFGFGFVLGFGFVSMDLDSLLDSVAIFLIGKVLPRMTEPHLPLRSPLFYSAILAKRDMNRPIIMGAPTISMKYVLIFRN